jgi:hypothetical protein
MRVDPVPLTFPSSVITVITFGEMHELPKSVLRHIPHLSVTLAHMRLNTVVENYP